MIRIYRANQLKMFAHLSYLSLLYFFRFHFFYLLTVMMDERFVHYLHMFVFSQRRSKTFEDWGELKSFSTGGRWGGLKNFRDEEYFCWGVSTPLHAMKPKNTKKQKNKQAKKQKHQLCAYWIKRQKLRKVY